MSGNDLMPVALAVGAVAVGAVYWLMSSKADGEGGGSGKAKGKPFLDKSRQTVKLIKKDELSPDTFRFRFALPDEKTMLGLPIGKHIKIYGKTPKGKVPGEWNGKPIPDHEKETYERKYTPTSSDMDLGYFDLVIKVYAPGHTYSPPRERFVDGGMMSQMIGALKLGESMDIAGPFGHIEYKGHGRFEVNRKPIPVAKHVGMIAGGTGITPMLQIIDAVLRDETDDTTLHLLFANQTEEDILLRDVLEERKKQHPRRFKFYLTLDRPPTGWKGFTGFITDSMLVDSVPPASPESLILMCGPPPMLDYACRPNLEKLGHDKSRILAF